MVKKRERAAEDKAKEVFENESNSKPNIQYDTSKKESKNDKYLKMIERLDGFDCNPNAKTNSYYKLGLNEYQNTALDVISFVSGISKAKVMRTCLMGKDSIDSMLAKAKAKLIRG